MCVPFHTSNHIRFKVTNPGCKYILLSCLLTLKYLIQLSLVCRVYNLHVKIIKHIQASNEQYKFEVDLYKYHDVLNIGNYFMI